MPPADELDDELDEEPADEPDEPDEPKPDASAPTPAPAPAISPRGHSGKAKEITRRRHIARLLIGWLEEQGLTVKDLAGRLTASKLDAKTIDRFPTPRPQLGVLRVIARCIQEEERSRLTSHQLRARSQRLTVTARGK